jgi:hypothetical protein
MQSERQNPLDDYKLLEKLRQQFRECNDAPRVLSNYVAELWAAGKTLPHPIELIKAARTILDLGLKDGKDVVDKLFSDYEKDLIGMGYLRPEKGDSTPFFANGLLPPQYKKVER